jgi:hypothetical protein
VKIKPIFPYLDDHFGLLIGALFDLSRYLAAVVQCSSRCAKGSFFVFQGNVADGPSVRRAMEDAKRILARGGNVVFFPEGLFTVSGPMLPFKSGAFKLALETGCPIVPLFIEGSLEAMHPLSPLVSTHRTQIVLHIGAPMYDCVAFAWKFTGVVLFRITAQNRGTVADNSSDAFNARVKALSLAARNQMEALR